MKASFPLLLAALFSVLMPSDAMAQRDGFGIVIIAGDPTGLCIKNWLSQKSALEMAAAWSFEGNGGFFLSGDYVLHSFGISGGSGLMLTYGLGGRLYFRDGDKNNDGDTFLGLRVPLGLCYPIEGAPVDIFLQLAPVMDLIPETELRLNGGVGARLYL